MYCVRIFYSFITIFWPKRSYVLMMLVFVQDLASTKILELFQFFFTGEALICLRLAHSKQKILKNLLTLLVHFF